MTRHPGSLEIDRAISATEALGSALTESKSPVLPAAAHAAAPAAKKHVLRRLLLVCVGLGALAAAGVYARDYWTVGRFQIETDDAYVQADTTTIAPKVPGYIAQVLVGDNEPVKAGAVLARIDDRDYKVALQQAEADVAAAKAAIASKQAALETQASVIDSAKATVAVDAANETFAEQDDKRYSGLANAGIGAVRDAQSAVSRVAAAHASVERDQASLTSATKQVDQLKAELAQAQASLARAQAAEDQAKLNLSYTNIVAPVDGVVGNRTLRTGQYVQAGTQLMSVVPVSAAYIEANYKETQLTDVHPGQPVDIRVDMFPDRVYHGRVDSLSPASGQSFALLPPDNATGNFTKVVQRIPVKITLDDLSAADLRPGMSVIPSIDTKASAATKTVQANVKQNDL
ncbi:HlyD family secretion protein [Methylovirgula sp. 4M-Z18]|uniref:HlyD family secretion protein n=1 Tax=Methylovirgula sp. 4M-Z18 TaxID=2293567 RepID=UPI000E2F05EB|nr:HlyD family secretion protein [Methylovirgula sp. 4M-Z18]RFB79474.1 HlyD family secretion protein [Methylovirgula sp. 4M-Z18]